MSATVVKDAWTRIETWCRRHHPRLMEVLNPGESQEELLAIERTIDQLLPEDVRTSLLIHNGQAHQGVIFCSARSISPHARESLGNSLA